MKETLKKVGQVGMGLAIMAALFALPVVFILGVEWATAKLLPAIFHLVGFAIPISVFILLPLAIPARTRPWAGVCLYLVSFLFGLSLWLYGAVATLHYWGRLGLIIGLAILGIGVVPTGYIASIQHADWPALGNLCIGTVLTFGARSLGRWMLGE
ncbi:MAG: hypothetical protein ACLQVL_13770 [Terriglobia bacterium]